MTREEAIEIFKNMLDAWDNYYTIAQSDKKREAVWLAISSLETDEAYQLEYERTTKNDSSELEKNSKKLEKDIGELDCISRADAIQAMQDKAKKLTNEDTINGLCGAVAILFELPSVTPQVPRWIPTSERLPDTDDEVLCWYEYYHQSRGKVLPEYGIGCYFKETSSWFGEVAIGHKVRVIAWMPLPQTYREVEE